MARPKKIPPTSEWDYLVITASNEKQAEAYRSMVDARRALGFSNGVRNVLVVADPNGRRIGSGGSTIHSLLHILKLELRAKREVQAWLYPKTRAETFNQLRVLIVHAGGDSRRLPPYGPCGKLFVPVPGESSGVLGTTLFDLLIPTYLRLPRLSPGPGQVVVASGDVLLDFDPEEIVFAENGITGVGALVNPDVAKNHGVYCRREDGSVRMFLQKPSVAKQAELGAVNAKGQAVLDIGILNFAPAAAVRLIELCDIRKGREDKRGLVWKGPIAGSIEKMGLDIYREICCALGRDTCYSAYFDEVKKAGSGIDDLALRSIYHGLKDTPFHVHVVPRLRFLHFGTLQDLIESGITLSSEMRDQKKDTIVVVNSRIIGQASIQGKHAWVEGSRIEAPLVLAGDNVVVGLDVTKPLALPRGGCLDVIEGEARDGRHGWFLRTYFINDNFHINVKNGGRLCGRPILDWLGTIGASPADVWEAKLPTEERSVWNGRFFPIIRDKDACQVWIWQLDPENATACQKEQWRTADRYSFEEMAIRADLESFHSRRMKIRSELLKESLSQVFGPESRLSSSEIALLVRNAEKGQREDWIVSLVREAIRAYRTARTHQGLGSLILSRILHTLGSVLMKTMSDGDRDKRRIARDIAEALKTRLSVAEKSCLKEMGLPVESGVKPRIWASQVKEAAFRHLGQTIVYQSKGIPPPPKNALRSDEIVWGRAPARLDLGGGWTDTPPYCLEQGGCVINAAVNLNGQAPIQAYARVIGKHEIRINSIDHGTRVVVKSLEDLLNYQKPGSQFALAKAALALAGFTPEAARWPDGIRTLSGMLRFFGGGIELTTLAAIPSGSGLGTSSIMGAVLLSTIGKIFGRTFAQRELFHGVLKLEQALTTGGGWQDQIGGAIEGVKMIRAEKGLVPDPRIHFVRADLLDPLANGGRTLLYYTGLRRLAKDILHEVVGRYLDRDRGAMETLRQLHAFPPLMAEAMATRDAERFGELIDVAWKLNVDLDPDHTNPIIEELRTRIKPYVLGAKLLGAGGGGFLLMVCKSPDDAAALKRMLQKKPPNDKARFFDYSINNIGLNVTVC